MRRAGGSVATTLSDGQASYVVERLRAERRISDAEIQRYIADLGREISDLEVRLARLRALAGGPETHSEVEGGSRPAPRAKRRKRTRSVSTNASAARPTAPASVTGGEIAPKKRRKRRFTVTPKVLASRELQGRYLPLLNKFTGSRRAGFAKIAKERGRKAAISAMESTLR